MARMLGAAWRAGAGLGVGGCLGAAGLAAGAGLGAAGLGAAARLRRLIAWSDSSVRRLPPPRERRL